MNKPRKKKLRNPEIKSPYGKEDKLSIPSSDPPHPLPTQTKQVMSKKNSEQPQAKKDLWSKIKEFINMLPKAARKEWMFVSGSICLAVAWYYQTVEISNLEKADTFYSNAIRDWNFNSFRSESNSAMLMNEHYHVERYEKQFEDTSYLRDKRILYTNLFQIRVQMQHALFRIEFGEDSLDMISINEALHRASILQFTYPDNGKPASPAIIAARATHFSNTLGKWIEENQEECHNKGAKRIIEIRSQKECLEKWVIGLLIGGTILINLNYLRKYINKGKNSEE